MLDTELPTQLAKELHASKRDRRQVAQFSKRHPTMEIADSYAIQREWMKLKLGESRHVVGHKIGLTSRAMQLPSQIPEPDYARNTPLGSDYGSHIAQLACQARQRAAQPCAKLHADDLRWGLVLILLDWKWSPQQIAATLKRAFPDQPERHVSHETIYTAFYAQPRGELRRQLIACLRQGRSTRLARSRGNDRRGQIPEMVSIHMRPPEVEDRVMPGHWEAGLIKGASNKSSVGVLVERSTRLVLLAEMEDATAASALAGCTAKLNSGRRADAPELHV